MIVHVIIHYGKKIIFGGFKHEFNIKLPPHFLSFLRPTASSVYKSKIHVTNK